MSLPSTEIQRVVLVVLLGVVGYLLVYNWNQDYGPSASKPRVSPTSAAEDAVPAAPMPVAETGPEAADDIPREELSGSAEPPGFAGEDVDMATSSRIVSVRTPTLAVWIDRLGGDIVRLELPRYPRELGSEEAVRLLDRGPSRTYIAQSGLIGRDGLDKNSASRPLYDIANRAPNDYSLQEGVLELALRHETGDVVVEKRFLFDAESYEVSVEHSIDNRTATEFRARLFAQLKRDASRPESDGFGMGPRPYVGAAFTTPDSRYEKIDFDDLDEEPFRTDVRGGWAAMLQHYFLAAWAGDADEVNAYNGRRLGDGNYAVGYIAPELVVPAGERRTVAARLYAGPKIQKQLEEVAPNLYLTVDYGLLWWLSVPLFYVLDAINSVVGNWGVAIILLTVTVKILLFPLASAGFRSMARMKKLAPQMSRLKERYGSDRQKLSQEMMALYRKEGANPLGGCLPLLLQMPVFFALYWVLYESVELRQAPFIFWIKDLAALDPWFVLPILYGASFFAMQLMQPPPPDPMQAKVMKAMPIIFTVLFMFFPAGLVLYWLVNNVLSLAQQWFITRQIERKTQPA